MCIADKTDDSPYEMRNRYSIDGMSDIKGDLNKLSDGQIVNRATIKNLNIDCNMLELRDRVLRFELRERYGSVAAPWDIVKDCSIYDSIAMERTYLAALSSTLEEYKNFFSINSEKFSDKGKTNLKDSNQMDSANNHFVLHPTESPTVLVVSKRFHRIERSLNKRSRGQKKLEVKRPERPADYQTQPDPAPDLFDKSLYPTVVHVPVLPPIACLAHSQVFESPDPFPYKANRQILPTLSAFPTYLKPLNSPAPDSASPTPCLSKQPLPYRSPSPTVTPKVNSIAQIPSLFDLRIPKPADLPLTQKPRTISRTQPAPRPIIAGMEPAGNSFRYKRCFNCNGYGHPWTKCPTPLGKFCRKCGQVGKTVITCDECKEAYRQNYNAFHIERANRQ